VAARTAEKQRVEKLLEDAQIKLSAVASDIFGVSGRQMLAALIAGQRDPRALAQLARGVMRAKITTLQEAFTGYFTDRHAFLLAKMLARVDVMDADIAALDKQIEQVVTPFAAAVQRLAEIPGISRTAACAILAEIGTDMGRFPTAGHLLSWAKFAPGVKESAGKKKGKGTTGHGSRYLARILGNTAASAGRRAAPPRARARRCSRRIPC
jgi:transposase